MIGESSHSIAVDGAILVALSLSRLASSEVIAGTQCDTSRERPS